jgi:hypothetical protein
LGRLHPKGFKAIRDLEQRSIKTKAGIKKAGKYDKGVVSKGVSATW